MVKRSSGKRRHFLASWPERIWDFWNRKWPSWRPLSGSARRSKRTTCGRSLAAGELRQPGPSLVLRRGRTGEALDLLDNLLNSGESPHKIVAGLTFVFRRLAQSMERVREGSPLEAAIREAGVFPREAAESAAYLRRLGRAERSGLIRACCGPTRISKGASRLPSGRSSKCSSSNSEAHLSCRAVIEPL